MTLQLPRGVKGWVDLAFRSSLSLAVALSFPLGPGVVHAQDVPIPSEVMGTVFEHETGSPLAGAAVSLASGPGGTDGLGTRVTDAEGRFLFRNVPPGTYRLIVTFIGFRTVRDTLPVAPDLGMDLRLPMSISPVELEPIVVVTERRSPRFMQDFEERQRTRSGTFFDREDIEARQPYRVTDLLRMVPGASIIPTSPFSYTVRLRGGCQPSLWIDGMQLMTVEGMDDILLTQDLEAVEVYHSAALPVQFGSSSCGAIIAWTRRGEPVEGGGSFWRRFGIVVAFGLVTFLLTH